MREGTGIERVGEDNKGRAVIVCVYIEYQRNERARRRQREWVERRRDNLAEWREAGRKITCSR